MAFSIKQIKAVLSEHGMPVEELDKAAEEICGRHSADLDSIKEQRDNYRHDAETLAAVQQELDALKARPADEYKAKYEQALDEIARYKERETQAARDKAVRAFFEANGITGERLEIAMRGASAEIAALEMDGENIRDTAPLQSLVNGAFALLVETRNTQGTPTPTPPTNTGGSTMTREDILKIKDTAARQTAIAQHLDLFGKG